MFSPVDVVPQSNYVGNDPLPIPSSIGQQTLKRKVDQAFHESWDQASKRLTTAVKVRQGKFDSVEKLLELYGSACGACIMLGSQAPSLGHRYQDCPTLSPTQIEACKKLKQNVNYNVWPETNGACWKCHIPAGGQNQWHGDYGSSECTHPYLVWSIAYLVWSKAEWREAMRSDLGIKENLATDTDFTKWFTGKHPIYFTNSIALLSWVSTPLLSCIVPQ